MSEVLPYQRKEIIGDCTLYLGDCRDILPTLGKVGVCLTDPPYGIGLAGGFSGAGGFSKPIARRQYDGEWDDETPDQETFSLVIAAAEQAIIWGGNYFTDKLPQGSFWLVWDKQNTIPTFSDAELAWTNITKKSVKRIVYQQNGLMSKEKDRFHPTQKAIEVMKWSLSHAKQPFNSVVDPFMGSGTTGVACASLKLKFIGIERDEAFFDIACERIRKAYAQPDLFITPPAPQAKQEAFDGL